MLMAVLRSGLHGKGGAEVLDDPALAVVVELAELVHQHRLVDLLVPPVDGLRAEQRPLADELRGDTSLDGAMTQPALESRTSRSSSRSRM